jgi:site-specific DNA recombinase
VTTAAIYLRQSLDRTGERQAVRRQLEACRALCKAKGWEIHGQPYEDNDVSASSLKPRPQYKRLLADARARRFDAIVVWHIDRLARRMTDLEEVISLGLPIATATGDMDLSTDVGRLLARILGAVAQGEAERKAARQKLGNQQRAAQGVPHASPPPFGYRRVTDDGKAATLVIEPAEADAIKTGYRLLLAGATLRGIAAEWNSVGLRTSAGGDWTGWSVGRRLKSPAYAGLTVYNGEEIGTGNWEPLIEEGTYRAAIAVLGDPARRTTMDQTRRYLLPGLAFCGVEGCTFKVSTGRSHRLERTYVCKAKHLARAAEPIDSMITGLLVARLSRPDARELLYEDRQPDGDHWRDRAQALRAKLDAIALAWAEDQVSDSQFKRTTEKLRADLADAESRVSYSSRADVLRDLVTKDAAMVWEALPLDRQRAAIDALLTVTLLPPGRGKKKLDPATVKVAWKKA